MNARNTTGATNNRPSLFLLTAILYHKKMRRQKKRAKNPVCIIWWRDAARCFDKTLPSKPPLLQVTAGFIIVTNRKKLNIATNVNYNSKTGKLWPVDGFVIPKGTIVKFKKLENLS